MITAVTEGKNGKRIVILGVTRENVMCLTVAKQPIFVDADKHAGFPDDLTIAIIFGETERALTEQLKPLIGDATKIVTVPHGPAKPVS